MEGRLALWLYSQKSHICLGTDTALLNWLQMNLNDLSITNLLVSMTVKASSVMSGPEPLIVFALK